MIKQLGQNRREWKKQIENSHRLNEITDPRAREIISEIIFKKLAIDTTKDKIFSDTKIQIIEKFNKIEKNDNKSISQEKFEEYYHTTNSDDLTIEKTKRQMDKNRMRDYIEKKIVTDMEDYFDKRYLKRLKNTNKKGVINALFITSHKGLFKNDREHLMDFLLSLTVEDYEFLYKQSAKIANFEGINVVDINGIDKHFCQIFDKEKIKLALPIIDGYGFIDVWDETIGISIAVMKKVFPTNTKKKKGQLDFLSLVILYHELQRLSGELISDMIYKECSELSKKNVLPKSDDEFEKFTDYLNKEYQKYLIVFKKEYMEIFNKIPESTFYRRQKNLNLFIKSLLKKEKGKKYIDFYDYYKATKTKHTFGIKEPK